MGLTPKKIFHITHFKNLNSIITQGGLHAVNFNKIKFEDIADPSIQDKRSKKIVPCGADGNLHDYVPFYFAPRSPMLCRIDRRDVKEYARGQIPIIHLVSNTQLVQEYDLQFVFTDGHGTMAITEFYDDLSHLDDIDWTVMDLIYWNDTPENSDRKRRRQAEFLVYEFFPWECINSIGVYDDKIQQRVMSIVEQNEKKVVVKIQKDWYY